jgi:hypothetical protein
MASIWYRPPIPQMSCGKAIPSSFSLRIAQKSGHTEKRARLTGDCSAMSKVAQWGFYVDLRAASGWARGGFKARFRVGGETLIR